VIDPDQLRTDMKWTLVLSVPALTVGLALTIGIIIANLR